MPTGFPKNGINTGRFLKGHKPIKAYSPLNKTGFCNIEGCYNKYYAKGLCHYHYNRIYLAEYRKQWEEDNKERRLKYRKQYCKDNKKRRAGYNKQYCAEHKEQVTKRHKQYYDNNKERIAKRIKKWSQTLAGKAYKKAAKIRRKTQDKDFIKETILRVYKANIKKYGVLTCYLCGEPIVFGDERLKDSIDHSTPISRKGSNDFKNLGIAHQHCNNKKNTMTLKQWFRLTDNYKGMGK